MIDIDHFKDVNGRLGHAAGDAVLKNVAAICRAEKGESDVLARVGGEEFAILLPETTQSRGVPIRRTIATANKQKHADNLWRKGENHYQRRRGAVNKSWIGVHNAPFFI